MFSIYSSFISLFKKDMAADNSKSTDRISDTDNEEVILLDIGPKPTEDQVNRARALQLPDSFFLYENSSNKCPGCKGCDVGL